MPEKITIKTVKEKNSGEKDGRKWKVCTVTTEDGRTFDTFDTVEPGKEYEVNIKESSNPAYNPVFSIVKNKKFGPGKDYTFEKKRVALECAVRLIVADKYPPGHLTEIRDRFFKYLNNET